VSNKYHIKIGEIEFSLEGDADYIEKERSIFFGGILPQAVDAMANAHALSAPVEYTDVPIPTITDGKLTSASSAGLSLNEFLNTKGFSSQINNAIGLMYYYENEKDRTDFSSEDLKQYFKDAKIIVPQNPSDVINKLIGKAFIMQTDQKGRYKLTRTGIDFVEAFVTSVTKEKKASAKPRKPRTKIESVYANLSADDLNLKNYPEVKEQDSFKKQMMLTMYIVSSEVHGDAFSIADVQCVMTDILGLPASRGQVQGVFDRNASWFKDVSDETNAKSIKHRLLEGAKDFAKSLIDYPK
jgi:hypothetical protein